MAQRGAKRRRNPARASFTVASRTSARPPGNWWRTAWAGAPCTAQAIHTVPTGLSGVPPVGPAMPVTVLTLGLFLFVINALTFQMASGLLDGFQVHGFWHALFGSVVYSLWSIVIDVALERMFGQRAGLPPG